ncbi:hypothetical protein PoB_000938300 [Plakobranchus ocellatus]|uniref:Uncharacterized protein n=1 Tax=Plakobranchus ocellatus TaxID=259542 RepID=A0AAV3YK36_9GAST|nr:hypothetical protein PoB_000938300 [Plakobranchus ocellatus]
MFPHQRNCLRKAKYSHKVQDFQSLRLPFSPPTKYNLDNLTTLCLTRQSHKICGMLHPGPRAGSRPRIWSGVYRLASTYLEKIKIMHAAQCRTGCIAAMRVLQTGSFIVYSFKCFCNLQLFSF